MSYSIEITASSELRITRFDLYHNLRHCVTSDMEVDKVSSYRFDMSLVGEFDIVFFEVDSPFLFDLGTYFMFREATEKFPIFSLECEFD